MRYPCSDLTPPPRAKPDSPYEKPVPAGWSMKMIDLRSRRGAGLQGCALGISCFTSTEGSTIFTWSSDVPTRNSIYRTDCRYARRPLSRQEETPYQKPVPAGWSMKTIDLCARGGARFQLKRARPAGMRVTSLIRNAALSLGPPQGPRHSPIVGS